MRRVTQDPKPLLHPRRVICKNEAHYDEMIEDGQCSEYGEEAQ